ncbi:MAG: GcvT family protein [Hyphomicrobiaceae bacterium]
MNSQNLPSHASVVVIGGGVMGCSTLYHLAKNGLSDTILLERNKLTSGTTWHSAAQVRALRSTRNLTDLIRYSISLYSELEQETGQITGWINKGSLSIAASEDRLVHIHRQEALAKLFGVRAKAISAGEAKERWPLMNADDLIGAVWSPDDGRVSPSDLCAALIKGARSRGAKVFEDTGVTAIFTDGGKIVGLDTVAGQIKCDAIALCTGLWSRDTAAMAGAEVPVWPCEHFYLLTKPVEGIAGNMPTLSDHDSHLYIRDDSGGLLIGCFEPMGKPIAPESIGHNFAFQLLPEDWDHFEPMMMNALHRLPVLETAEVKMLLNGPESFTPDGSFLLGETAETRGLFLGCGMNSVGVATGGGAGMALAHAILNGSPPIDLHEADPKRFASAFNSVEALRARVPEVLGKHYEITYPARQWSTSRNLSSTPLHDKWFAAKAHFGQVADWERPLYFNKTSEPRLTFAKPDWFDNVGQEVDQAHNHVAIFDQSTFGKIDVRGVDASAFLNRVCANQMDRPPGRAIYTAMLNEAGGMESDLTAVRLSDDHYRLYVGTTATRRDLSWLRRHVDDARVALTETTRDFAVMGLMGPDAAKIATAVGADNLNELSYFRSKQTEIAGCEVLGVRLSYVGEAGWELTCKAEEAPLIYDALQAQGARPSGSLAQTSMRIEKRFLAYGHDLDTDICPIESGLEFAVGWDTNFVGRDALLRKRDEGKENRLVSLVFDDAGAVPLGNEPVYLYDTIVGKTTSAAFGYRTGKPVAIADLLVPEARNSETRLLVDIAGQRFDACVRVGAAFDPTGERMRGSRREVERGRER